MAYNTLIVDDSPVIRAVVKRALGMVGLEVGEVHEAANGLQALEVLGNQWIDLVFADLNMPEMSGMELIDRMAADDLLEKTPVIVITSDRNVVRLAELEARGVRATLNKPFRPETLKEVLGDVLGGDWKG